MTQESLKRVGLIAMVAGVAALITVGSLWFLAPPAQEETAQTPLAARDRLLRRVQEHSPFRQEVQEPLPPDWPSARSIAGGSFEQAQLQGVGKVSVRETSSGRWLLLEDYSLDFAPGFHVALLPGGGAELPETRSDLGELRQAAGRQLISIPSDIRLEAIAAVGVFDPNEGLLIVRAPLVFQR